MKAARTYLHTPSYVVEEKDPPSLLTSLTAALHMFSDYTVGQGTLPHTLLGVKCKTPNLGMYNKINIQSGRAVCTCFEPQ